MSKGLEVILLLVNSRNAMLFIIHLVIRNFPGPLCINSRSFAHMVMFLLSTT